MINFYGRYDGIQTLTGHLQRGLTGEGILTMSVLAPFLACSFKKKERGGRNPEVSSIHLCFLKETSDQLPTRLSVMLGGHYTVNQMSHHKITHT